MKRNSKWGNKYHFFFIFLKYAPSTLPTYRDCVCLNCWLLATMLNGISIVVVYVPYRTHLYRHHSTHFSLSLSFSCLVTMKTPYCCAVYHKPSIYMRFLISLNYLLFSGFLLLLLIFHCNLPITSSLISQGVEIFFSLSFVIQSSFISFHVVKMNEIGLMSTCEKKEKRIFLRYFAFKVQ